LIAKAGYKKTAEFAHVMTGDIEIRPGGNVMSKRSFVGHCLNESISLQQ